MSGFIRCAVKTRFIAFFSFCGMLELIMMWRFVALHFLYQNPLAEEDLVIRF